MSRLALLLLTAGGLLAMCMVAVANDASLQGRRHIQDVALDLEVDVQVEFTGKVDARSAARTVALPRPWQKSIGSGHALLGLRDDWRLGLKTVREELEVEHVRFHGIFDDDIFQLKRDPSTQMLVYNYTLVDSVYDYITGIGMKPFVELSFMPIVMASGSATWMHYKANITPPTKMSEWHDLVRNFASHLQERYGDDEVSTWFFEVWNEPNAESGLNFGTGFFAGDQQQYFDMYTNAAKAIKSVNPAYKVGGPASSGGNWLDDFLTYIQANDIPCDFVSSHQYPSLTVQDTDPKDVANHVATVREYSDTLPFILSEYNCGIENGIPGLVAKVDNADSEIASSFIIRNIGRMATDGVAMLSYWTFSDVFDEIRLSTKPFHNGYGMINMDNIRKPAYRAFQMLGKAGQWMLPVETDVETDSSCDVWATATDGELTLFLTSFSPVSSIKTYKTPFCALDLSIAIDAEWTGISAASITRVDRINANAYTAWKDMNKPDPLSTSDINELNSASQLLVEDAINALNLDAQAGVVSGHVRVPPFGSAVVSIQLTK